MSTPPYIDTYIHVSGLLISILSSANSLFVRDKYVTPAVKRLHQGYAENRMHVKHTI